MTESRLDELVKGAPAPNVSVPKPAPSIGKSPDADVEAGAATSPFVSSTDPVISTLPSSPPQIYLNLLILEASLRSQYLTLRARRRQYTFFLLLLTLWISYFGYALFLRPREDGSGVGGSVYWVVEMGEKLALMGGVVTGILIWGTGQWERGIRWPRRWVAITNRGLRTMNTKIVVVKGPWWKEMISHLSFLFPFAPFSASNGSSYHFVPGAPRDKRRDIDEEDEEEQNGVEEDLASGGDYIKLLLLPKPFSPAFRENWDTYRSEYWEKENERRAGLGRKLRQRQRHLAKEQGGWLWWTGWRGWKKRANGSGGRGGTADKPHRRQHYHHHHHHHSQHHQPLEKELPRYRTRGLSTTSGTGRSGSNSRGSSRSSTNTPEMDDRPLSEQPRRGSSHASGAGERRKKLKATGGGSGTIRSLSKITPTGSRPTTPPIADPPRTSS
ncbi:hypothetical protein L228DRAFT_246254 [Xylona heveae TC161]|uniref:Spo7-domain-containing protein n=1 Tax=Xylona heveae (strain CBS 132557 / TC161) TaxID=1328760 RepID=A0A165HGL0_XYLHT|nr:hypothetical protein L228DRAFT_246254 [Xylona heveae TC161]KZF23482.1 hypothetical protein L228DRAFT_246254 [Xylona heveae TC161]